MGRPAVVSHILHMEWSWCRHFESRIDSLEGNLKHLGTQVRFCHDLSVLRPGLDDIRELFDPHAIS